MDDRKQRAAILLTLALVGVLVNIVMFSAEIGSWFLILLTLVAFGWGFVLLVKKS